jgi:predicted SAM-dependent methyltransferase
MERHRLAYLVAGKCKNLDYSKVIHVAPEKELSKWLRSNSKEYLSIDLYAEAMAKMDITNLELEDNSQTLIWASHVLEHVIDDRKAIAELYRVLAPSGIAFIQVPIWRTKTFEDFTRSTPEERLKEFYQPDHVRLYGLDITDRFEEVGFSSEIVRAQDFGPDALLENGLSFASTDEVFVFQKRNRPKRPADRSLCQAGSDT